MADGWVEEVASRAKQMGRGDLFQSTLLHDIHSWVQDNQDCVNPVIVKAITNIRATAGEHIVKRMQGLAGDCRAEVMTLLCDVSTLHETMVCDGEHKTCAHMKSLLESTFMETTRRMLQSEMALGLEPVLSKMDADAIRLAPVDYCGENTCDDTRPHLGVFADRDMKRGDFVTTYRPDVLCIQTPIFLATKSSENTTAIFGVEAEALSAKEQFEVVLQYGIETGRADVALMASLPHPGGAPLEWGHLVNDGAYNEDVISYPGLHFGICPNESQLRNIAFKYYASAKEKVNAHFVSTPEGANVVELLRDVKEGEEITVTYGIAHWLKRALKESVRPHDVMLLCNESMTKLFVAQLSASLRINVARYERMPIEYALVYSP